MLEGVLKAAGLVPTTGPDVLAGPTLTLCANEWGAGDWPRETKLYYRPDGVTGGPAFGWVADYSQVPGGSGYNVAFDLWVCSGPRPSRETITAEVMVWLYRQDTAPNGRYISPGLYQGVGPGGWPVFTYLRDGQAGTVDLLACLTDLANFKLIDPEHWLADIEVGTEIKGGKGYPSCVYGWKPWMVNSLTDNLPRRIRDLKKAAVRYGWRAEGDNEGRVAFVMDDYEVTVE